MKLNRKWILVMSLVLSVAMATSGTMAYLTSTDSDVNVMTLGNVKIAQHEYERVVGADGNYEVITVTKADGTTQDSYKLQEFTQDKPLLPAVGNPNGGYDSTYVRFEQLGDSNKVSGGQQFFANLENAQDKIVLIENTGKTNAYVRTIFAFEMGTLTDIDEWHTIIKDCTGNNGEPWSYEYTGVINIDGNNYALMEAVYTGYSTGNMRHNGGILPDGEWTYNNLAQVYMTSAATNEDVEALDGNNNGTYDILVLSQAVQAAGFADAETALDAGFGDVNKENATKWFANVTNEDANNPDEGDQTPDPRVEYNGVIYEDIYAAVTAASQNGGTIEMRGAATLDEPLAIPSNVTINGNGYKLTRADGYTGTMITVAENATLNTQDLILDGDGATATGNLIATTGNGSIVLGEGTVLKNNHGSHAVNLATSGGGSLTLNGAQIINNSSDSGAIWGGGDIIVNEGSKINDNSSTGDAGAIRMVSGTTFTMNDGEISNNTAAGNGGAIWGYNASTYYFNGGVMANNTASSGGAMYSGNGSEINISGSFELCNNTASDSGGALRLGGGTTFNMTGGKVSGNISVNSDIDDGFYGWNPIVNITGGELADSVHIQGGYIPTVGGDGITGIVYFDLSTNHYNINLASEFGTIQFTVNENDEHFINCNFTPAVGYTYTEGDEAKLICMNEGYSTYWDATTQTFKLKADN